MARPGLHLNPKFLRLVRILGEPVPHVRGYLECMWEVAYQNGNPVLGDALGVEVAAQYPGEEGKLFRCLLECRLIDEVGDKYEVHDLFQNAPRYVRLRMKREAKRNAEGQEISDLRRAAALTRWAKEEANADANGMQTDASERRLHANGYKRDANGCTPNTQHPTPAPILGEESPKNPSCPEPQAASGRTAAKGKKKRTSSPGFDQFWAAYPRKVSKAAAEKAWAKIAPDAAQLAVILAAVEAHKASEKWRKDAGEFIPYPATWLNGRRWEDEVGGTGSSPATAETPAQIEARVLRQRAELEKELGPVEAKKA
jgi:hypothetical protein